MRLRSVVLLFILLAITALAVLNWATLTTASQVSLGLMVLEAPLGLIMLTLTALMAIFFLAYVLSLHGSVLLETRRHTKEMHAQRDLADKAEASRFTELRNYLDTYHQQSMAKLLERLDNLENHLNARATESDNSTAAYVGQLEQQLRTSSSKFNP